MSVCFIATCRRSYVAGIFALLTVLASTPAWADQEPAPSAEKAAEAAAEEVPEDGSGFHLRSGFALRAVPIGTRVAIDGGYRFDLFDSDSLLLKDTYVETGVTTEITPANFWGGPFIEIVPLAVLQLRASVHLLSYYGTFGYLYLPPDTANPDWDLDNIETAFDEGQSATGWMLDLRATPRAKVGNVVAMVPLQYQRIDMGVDQVYYESTFDFLLEPTDSLWMASPTLGYVLTMDDSWLLTALRWQHAESLGTELSRDMASLLGLFKLPGTLGDGEMQVAVVGGYWLDHPNRADTLYFAGEFSVDWKF